MNEFQNLIDDWISGEITPQGQAELNRHLCESQENSHKFAEEVALHYTLREVLLQDCSVPQALSKTLKLTAGGKRPRPRLTSFAGITLTAFATCIIIAVMAIRYSTDAQQPANEVLATNQDSTSPSSIRANDVAIVESSTEDSLATGIRPGDGLKQGDRFQLATGTARIKVLAGVTMDVAGPAALEFVSPMRVVLLSGRLTASVEQQAHGFTVVTPRADIIDLGTQFGVNVNEHGDSDIVVFSGAVDVHYSQGDKPERQIQHLSVGEALRVRAFGQIYPITVIQKGLEPVKWSAEVSDPACVISRVTDNFVGPDQPIYYGIVPGGFDEDVLAYVDRPYQWNSLAGVPFPEALRGGDYIQMFNSLKFVLNLTIKVQLRFDADVYVLMDERVPVPSWLRTNFEETEFRIGIDEYRPGAGPNHRLPAGPLLDSVQQLGTGPGVSVDTPFRIWKTNRPAGSIVTFGSLLDSIPDEIETRHRPLSMLEMSMYGIVIVSSGQTAQLPDVVPHLSN